MRLQHKAVLLMLAFQGKWEGSYPIIKMRSWTNVLDPGPIGSVPVSLSQIWDRIRGFEVRIRIACLGKEPLKNSIFRLWLPTGPVVWSWALTSLLKSLPVSLSRTLCTMSRAFLFSASGSTESPGKRKKSFNVESCTKNKYFNINFNYGKKANTASVLRILDPRFGAFLTPGLGIRYG